MFVFLVFCNFGFYMEPDVRVLGVFEKKKYALEYIEKIKNKDNFYRRNIWVKKYKIRKGLN